MPALSRYQIKHFRSIDSTAEYALKNIEELNHLDIITADKQTAGQGQFERRWISPDGNLYMTIIFKNLKIEPEQMLGHSSTAVIETLESFGLKEVTRKLPNDILVNNKKIAGILIKNIFRGQHFRAMMVSCGININMTGTNLDKIDQPATSIFNEINKKTNIENFTLKLLDNFNFEQIC